MTYTIKVDSDAQVVEVTEEPATVQVIYESPWVYVGIDDPSIGISVDTPAVEISTAEAQVDVSAPIAVVKVEAIGPRGAPGGGGRSEIINFPVPSTTWVVHPDFLGSVVVLDSAGDVIEPGHIEYNGNEITMLFSSAVSGTVYCFD